MISPELLEKIVQAEQAIVPDHLKEKGYIYYDPGVWFTPDMWDLFLERLGGEHNIELVTWTRASRPEGVSIRATMFISPKGLANLRKVVMDEQNK